MKSKADYQMVLNSINEKIWEIENIENYLNNECLYDPMADDLVFAVLESKFSLQRTKDRLELLINPNRKWVPDAE